MTVPVAVSHADSHSDNNSTARSSNSSKHSSSSTTSDIMSVTAPVSKADGTKVVTARSAPVQARKAALAKSNTPQKSVKLQQTNAYKSVEQYWTPERLSHAKPAPFQSKMSKTSMQKATAKATKLLKNDVTRTSDKVSKANGKVFFRGADGGDYACSGSVVNSSSKRIVVTAGHCVHGGKGSAWHTNWVFVPNYSNDNKPQGTFHAQYLHTLHDWAVNGENGKGFNSDVGFVTTMDNEQGKHVADVVGGGHKLVTAKNAQFNATVFGYPGNINNGQNQQICNTNTIKNPLEGFDFYRVNGCNFGGGASGGPWIANFNNKTGTGEIRSVTSFGPPDNPSFIAGPHFDKRVKNLFETANNDK